MDSEDADIIACASENLKNFGHPEEADGLAMEAYGSSIRAACDHHGGADDEEKGAAGSGANPSTVVPVLSVPAIICWPA